MAELLRLETIHLHSDEGRDIFDGLNWNLDKGCRVNIRCESGSGGPELLRLSAGVLHPEKGQVSLDGVVVNPNALSHPFLSRGAIGWVPGGGGLIVNLDLKSNITVPLRFVKGVRHAAADALTMAALEEAGLASLAAQRPHALELRERWLAALVRASVMEPELWLVEQPAGELDAHTRRAARRILDKAATNGSAMVILGEGAWMPNALQHWKLENGNLVPEAAAASEGAP